MKTFSKNWKSSKNPSKQRKYRAKAPIHIKKKLLSMNLSKDLRKKYSKRNVEPRKGDTVTIMKGKYKGKKGKISKLKIKRLKVYIEGLQVKKQDGSMVDVPFRASNLQITELNTDDKKRFKKLKSDKKTETTEKKKDSKKEENKENKKHEENKK